MRKKRLVVMGLIGILGLLLLPQNVRGTVSDDDHPTYPSNASDASIVYTFDENEINYEAYREQYEQVFPDIVHRIDLTTVDYSYSNGLYENEAPYVATFEDDSGIVDEGLYIPESGDLTIAFDVLEAGYYNVKIHYYTVEGRSASIQRGIKINGEYPFTEARSVSLSRVWTDSFDLSEYRVEGKNDLKPQPVEVHLWREETLRDIRGYYYEPYYFYFNHGENTMTLVSQREPVVISSIELYQSEKILSYEDVFKQYEALNLKKIDNVMVKVQGESSYQKSSPTLTPLANYSSYKIEPYERFVTRYNTIGGYNWRVAGDWISWQVEVPEDGLYLITFKALQNFNRGIASSRTLYINGKVPFEEVKWISFPYDNDWQNITISNEKGEPYYFYLKKGINEIRLESNIGPYGEVARRVELVTAELRDLYRSVVMKTGLNPDPYQDYRLEQYIPNLYERINEAKNDLEDILEDFVFISGKRGSEVGTFERTILQLEKFAKSEKNIQNGLNEFEENISALGNWVMSITNQPLTIDYLQVHDAQTPLPKVTTNFFQKLWHEFILFIGSFRNLDQFGSSVEGDGPTITVWITTGRDQASVLRQMIDETFTPQTGINVNLELVTTQHLLPATLAGKGPDVSIGVAENIPVNWGIRGAIQDLSEFPDFDTFKENFHPSALTPYTFDGKVYALPDTQDFLVTFYREDILSEIGIEKVPETWDEVIDILPVLQKNYLDFYLPSVQGAVNPVLYSMIEQYGGSLYLEDGKESGLMQDESLQAFLDFTRFFSDYGFVLTANFVNRFRTGEMPIGVSYFTDYNTFSVFAPEINGLWSYGVIPGTKDEEGNVNHMTYSRTTGTVMLADSEEKEAAWEFIKWWLGEDSQITYARNMEAILGAAARYPTANLKAFAQLPWPAKDYVALSKARESARGLPIVPGDYIVGRYVDNAFRAVINNNVSPYDSLYTNHLKINNELTRKRREFGLD